MSYTIGYSEKFSDDIRKHKKSGQKKLVDKITVFVIECQVNPRTGTGKPEQLKYRSTETWSREINKQHRLVYEISENEVFLLSAWGHYDDK